MTNPLLLEQKKTLRKYLRAERNKLSIFQQHNAAISISRSLNRSHQFKRSKNIALYLASDGELNCKLVIDKLISEGKNVYLPVLHPINRRFLWFIKYDQHTPMRFNRFGIKEPQLSRSRILNPNQLDIICMPLVGFDLEGNRLGMGGGFYDTTLEKVVNQRWQPTPKLVGLAHSCQLSKDIPKEPWDIKLDEIATPDKNIKPLKSRLNRCD